MCGTAGTGFARLILATPKPVLEEVVRRRIASVRVEGIAEGASRKLRLM